eukprot:gene1894-3670_t
MDAAIAIVNDTNRSDIPAFYNFLKGTDDGGGETVTVGSITLTDDDESTVWKNMIPVLNERCRSGWKHDEDCEYLSDNTSLSAVSCSPTRKHAKVIPKFICIALSPLFSVEDLTYNNSSSQNKTTPVSVPKDHKAVTENSPTSSSTSTTASVTDQNVYNSCGHCKKSDVKLSQCGRCKQISYCGRECQHVFHYLESQSASVQLALTVRFKHKKTQTAITSLLMGYKFLQPVINSESRILK